MNAADVSSRELRTAMDFREQAAGIRVPRLKELRAAEEQEVECRCGHVDTLIDVRWWGVLGKWLGTCRACHQSPTFTVPESAR